MSAKHVGFAHELQPSASGLTATERNVLVHLCFRANSETGLCFPSIADIREKTGLTDNTIRKALIALDAKAYVTIVRRQRDNGSWTSNEYVIDLEKIIAEVRACEEAKAAAKAAAKASRSKSKGDTAVTEVPKSSTGTAVSEVPPPQGGTAVTEVGYRSDCGTITKNSNLKIKTGAREPALAPLRGKRAKPQAEQPQWAGDPAIRERVVRDRRYGKGFAESCIDPATPDGSGIRAKTRWAFDKLKACEALSGVPVYPPP